MAGNKIYVQGSYIDIHDNEVVNLSVDKGEVHVDDQLPDIQPIYGSMPSGTLCRMDSQLCPAVGIKCTFAIKACD